MTKLQSIVLIAIAVFWVASVYGETLHEPRIALISSSGLEEEASILTAALSRPGVTMLERAEISKILAEQGLSVTSSSADAVQIGRLLKADGIIVLSTASERQLSLSARLVAVDAGVILREMIVPRANLQEACKIIAQQVTDSLPKLALSPEAAIPVSVLNLRSATRSPGSESLDRGLTIMLTERLTKVPEFFVLERRRLNDLALEKVLQSGEVEPFWNSSYLIDGTINASDVTKNRVSLDLRIRRLGQSQETVLHLSGDSDKLSTLISEAVAGLLQLTGRNLPFSSWDSDQEAKRYVEEGKWASKWHMLTEAENALESAWALGQKSREVSTLLIKAYSDHGNPRAAKFYYPENPSVRQGEPHPQQIEKAIMALNSYVAHTRYSGSITQSADPEWYDLGVSVVLKASTLLQECSSWSQNSSRQPDLIALRTAIRETAKFISQGNPLAIDSGVASPPGLRGVEKKEPASIDSVRVKFAQYWYDTPREVVDVYRDLFLGVGFTQPANLPVLRWEALRWGGLPQPFDWNSVGAAEISKAEPSLPEELAVSGGMSAQIYSALINMLSYNDADFVEAADKLLDLLWSVRGEIFEDRLNFDCAALVFEVIQSRCASHMNGTTSSFVKNRLRPYRLRFFLEYLQQAQTFSQQRVLCLTPESFEIANYMSVEEADRWRLLLARVRKNISSETRWIEIYERDLPRAKPALPNESDAPTLIEGPGHEMLAVARCWQAAVEIDRPASELRSGLPMIVAMRYKDNALWVELLFDGKGAVCRIDPMTLETETILFHPRRTGRPAEALNRSFEVIGGELYLSSGDCVEKYDKDSGAWVKTQIPLNGDALLWDVRGKIFISSNDAILEWDSKASAMKVLASARRVPARSCLDGLGRYGCPPVFAGPGETVRTIIRGDIYEWEPGISDWTKIHSVGKAEEASDFPGGTFFYDGSLAYNRVTAISQYESKLQMLLNENSSWLPILGVRGRWSYPPVLDKFDSTDLQRGLGGRSPGSYDGRRKGVAYDGKSLFLVVGPICREEERRPNIDIGGVRPFKKGHMLLYWFKEGVVLPQEIPVWLGFGAAKTREEVPAVGVNGAIPREFLLADSPQLLFVTERYRGELWIIPKSDVEKFR